VAWEARRVEELLERLVHAQEEQTKLLHRVAGYEAMAVLLLKQLVASQTAPTMPTPVGVTLQLAP
jgi:hypothetical protein